MDELVKKFVNIILAIDQVDDTFKELELEAGPFMEAVAEEMRQRGMSEERILGALKGAAWGRQHWSAIQEEIRLAPNILEG